MGTKTYPESFYYSKKFSKSEYSDTPTGYPDINELIKKRPYWRQQTSVKVPEKKTLVFADWSITSWSDETRAITTQQLDKLINDGFKIYVWNYEHLILLTKSELFKLSYSNRFSIIPSFHLDIIAKTVEKLHLVKDNIHVLDDYELDCLKDPPTTLHPRETSLRKLKDSVFWLQTIALLKSTRPKTEIVLLDEFSESTIEFFSKIKNEFPETSFRKIYRQLELKANDITRLITEGCLTIQTERFTENDIASLEELTCNENTVSAKELSQILSKTKNLRQLTLTSSILADTFSALDLSKLETLKISNCPLSADSLKQLLLNTPNLKTLAIENLDLSLSPGFDINLPLLEKLTLNDVCFKQMSLDNLFATANNLKILELSHCRSDQQEFKKDFSFPNLSRLEFIGPGLSLSQMEKIISSAPAMRDLTLWGKLGLVSKLMSLKLDSLESLELYGNEITNEKLHILLSKLTNLKALKLDFCNDLEGFFNEAESSLKNGLNLNELGIFCNVSPQLVRFLLSHTESLTKLAFGNIKTDCNQFIESRNLESLQTLRLYTKNLNATEIIKNAPNLQSFSHNFDVIDPELDALLKKRQLGKYSPNPCKAFLPNKAPQHIKSSIHSNKKMDADTKLDTQKEYNTQRIFYPIDSKEQPPPITSYRLNVYNKTWINPAPCSLGEAFALQKQGDPQLIQTQSEQCYADVFSIAKTLQEPKNARYFYGKQQLNLTNEWQALASLSPQEELTHFHVNPHAKIEIRYSLRDNQYYIRAKANQTITIDFLLKVPTSKLSLPSAFSKLIDKFKAFQSGDLKLTKDNPNGYDYLSYIKKQGKGACRHRALAFKTLVEEKFPNIPIRIIENSCHSYVEVKLHGQWISCDLGGYPAKLTIHEENTPHDQARHLTNQFIKQLETWNKATPRFNSVKEYSQHLLQPNEVKKCLVELANDRDVDSLQLALQAYCQSTSRPVYYINSPDDLICSAPFIKRTGNHGELKEGPGGLLHDFLQAHQNTSPAPVLVVNYAHFKADDLVRFNGLLDDFRHADGSPLPKHMKIIGLINPNKPDSYLGEDFYSRFDVVETSPLHSALLEQARPELPFISKEEAAKMVSIDLYHASDWKERLLGRWVPQNDNLYFIDGELTAALASGLPIELKNAPWEDPEFVSFWQQALLRKKIHHADRTITLPTNLKLSQQESYEWPLLRQQLTLEAGIHPKAEVLNPSRLSLFFNQYQCDNQTKTLNPILGIIEKQAKGVLAVNITAPLTDDEWAMVLTACQKHHVKLHCHVAPGVSPPIALTEQPWPQQTNIVPTWQGETPKTLVLTSSDVDTSVAMLTKNNEDWQIIDVSECRSSDLLIALNGELNKNSLRFEFNQSEKALLKALADKKNVILKGSFSDELIDSLAPLLIQRQHSNDAENQLVLVSDKPNAFHYINSAHHPVTAQEKQQCLENHFTTKELEILTAQQLEKEPLSQLQARLSFHVQHPSESTDNAWKGLYHLPIHFQLPEFDAVHSQEKAEAFIDGRLNGVNQILSTQPYAFLSGLTAVGKSTFVDTYLQDDNNVLYKGEAKMLAWAKDASSARKLLFIDEATIENRGWSEFEGLFNNPPGIVIQGVYYPLTEKHKVIFASNPLSYGGERQLAPLFTRHGNALLFEPMPLEFIYEVILKPVFEKTPLQADPLAIVLPLFKVYRFLCENSQNEVLISTRELQMMALLTLSAYQNNNNLNPTELAEYYAFELGKTLVPENLKENFLQQFTSFNPLPQQKIEDTKPSKFLITPSRQTIRQQLDELLQLRLLRQKGSNDTQKYGGINGIILEGEPGIGKSELVISTLLQHGFKKVMLNEEKQTGNIVYHMPVSMQFEDKKRLLLKAFDEGAVVIIDEINSSPMMERLLNDLLMGKTPEGNKPTTPGFLIIGTQNPPTMAGRINPSNALARRLIQTRLLPYETAEMSTILSKKGILPNIIDMMVNAFNVCVQKARSCRLSPAPTFRDLLKVADTYQIKEEKATNTPSPKNETVYDSFFNKAWNSLVTYSKNPTQFFQGFWSRPKPESHSDLTSTIEMETDKTVVNGS